MSDKIQELKCILKNNGKENPFENKLLRMLIKALEQLQAKTDECKELKDLIKMCGLTDIFQEYTALKQQLENHNIIFAKQELDLERMKQKLDMAINYINNGCGASRCEGDCDECNFAITKTEIDKIKEK